jgi:hypothetical protein
MLGIASLRHGEIENCVACRTTASCIFPLVAEAFHQRREGSEAAMRHFSAYLESRPDDLGVRWLLNLAAMTLGRYPDDVPPRQLIPLAPFQSKYDIGKFVNVASEVGLNSRGANMAGGSIFDDFNNDGWFDIFTSNLDAEQGAALYLNRGDGMFDDRTEAAGLAEQVVAQNTSHADFDNDGWLDVLLLRGGWESPLRPSLLRNNHDGTFRDVTIESGLGDPIASQAGAWADFDNDGFLDLFLAGEFNANRPDPRNRCRLHRNRGDGTFEDVSAQAGVQNDRFAKGAAWGDYDGDGYPDLYVSNMGQPNRLYHNNRNGMFSDVAPAVGVTEPIHSFACWFWDYDNDGRLDIYVNAFGGRLTDIIRSSLGQPTDHKDHPRLYRNEGASGFRDVSVEVGLDRVYAPMGANFADIDNDGYLDVYLGTGKPPYYFLTPNVMLHSVAARRFEDVTASSGTGHLQKGHGVSFADWDHDGDVDLFVEAGGATSGDKSFNLLFENPGHGNNWLTIKLVGTRTNRMAIGASIKVEVEPQTDGPKRIHRVVSGGSSFGGNSFTQTIGLGKAARVTRLEVAWPTSRTRTLIKDAPIGRAIEIIEGRDGYRYLNWGPIRRSVGPHSTGEQTETPSDPARRSSRHASGSITAAAAVDKSAAPRALARPR